MLTEQEVVEQLTRFYQTVDEAISERAPAWRPDGRPTRRRQSWRMQLLATAALLALIIGVAILIRESRLLNPTAPAASPTPAQAIKAYQAMIRTDEAKLLNSESNHCNTIQDTGCPAAAAVVIDAAQHWLDDFNRSQAPARFARVDAQARRNLAPIISDLNALVTAYRAQDQAGMDAAVTAGLIKQDFLIGEVADILGSSQGTVSIYAESVRAHLQALKDCQPCKDLVTRQQLNCSVAESQGCLDNVDVTRQYIERFQGSLLLVYAPDALAAKDERLQADLFRADQALVAMTATLKAGDQIQLKTNGDVLVRGLTAVDSDVADILATKGSG